MSMISNYDWSEDLMGFINGDHQDAVGHYNSYLHYCYKKFDETLTFDNAKIRCEQDGATLMEPNWSSEIWGVFQAINEQYGDDPSGYWNGMLFDDGFKYASSGSSVNVTRFQALQSQNYEGCVENSFYDGGMSWITTSCENELKFVCKRLSIFDEKVPLATRSRGYGWGKRSEEFDMEKRSRGYGWGK